MKFMQVEKSEKSNVQCGREVTYVFTTYRNDYYEIRKTETIFNDGDSFSTYDVIGATRDLDMPGIYIQTNWMDSDEQEYNVYVTTTSFGGKDLDFIDTYAKKLMKAVECARIIESMLEAKEL